MSPRVEKEIAVAGALSSEALERLKSVLKRSKASNTQRAYKDDWKVFSEWCQTEGQQAMPAKPLAVAAFLAWYAQDHRAASVARRLAGITWCHKMAGHPGLGQAREVEMAMEGIRRADGIRPTRKAPVDGSTLARMLAALTGKPLTLKRDRALILVGYAGAFRRAALCALDIADLTLQKDRLDILVRRGKEDQAGKGRTISIIKQESSDCAVRALNEWLSAASIKDGPVFRALTRWGTVRDARLSSATVAQVVKTAAVAAGLDPAAFAGHSLRAGHITEAARQGARLDEIMRVSGHKLGDTVLRYMRDADPLAGTSATKIWPMKVYPARFCRQCSRQGGEPVVCKACGRTACSECAQKEVCRRCS